MSAKNPCLLSTIRPVPSLTKFPSKTKNITSGNKITENSKLLRPFPTRESSQFMKIKTWPLQPVLTSRSKAKNSCSQIKKGEGWRIQPR